MSYHDILRAIQGFACLVAAMCGLHTATAQTLEVLHTFHFKEGSWPQGALVQGADGALYGTTHYGGATATSPTTGGGTVFRITTNGVFTKLHDFLAGTNGRYPRGGLVEGADGAFYGTTYRKSSSIPNTVIYRITTNGIFSASAVLDLTAGYFCDAALIRGHDDALYGTAVSGTAFRVVDANSSAIAVFAGTNGSTPRSRLLQAADQVFYGTTQLGGIHNKGTAFRFSIGGEIHLLAHFDGTNGAGPLGGLVQGTDGYLYGTTSEGGAMARGTVFRLGTNGLLTTLIQFDGTNGANPTGELLQGHDKKLYGTTWAGGTSDLGTAFQLDLQSGLLTTLISFDGTNGSRPYEGLLQGNDGHLYGAAQRGDQYDSGNIYRIVMPQSAPVLSIHVVNGSYPVLVWPTNASEYALQSSPQLGDGADWKDLETTPSVDGTNFAAPTPLGASANSFFRLRRR